MRDAALLAERLARPVNRIGTTADEYGRGDIDAGLDRGPASQEKNLMRKLHGKSPLPEPAADSLLSASTGVDASAYNVTAPAEPGQCSKGTRGCTVVHTYAPPDYDVAEERCNVPTC
jgi:hypothetical protein